MVWSLVLLLLLSHDRRTDSLSSSSFLLFSPPPALPSSSSSSSRIGLVPSPLKNNRNRYRNTASNSLVERLQMDIEVVNDDNNILSASEIQERKNSIQESIQFLETPQQQQQKQQKQKQQQYDDDDDDDGNDRFKPLIGFYNVSHVQTSSANKNDNPVGGKWTRKNKLTQQLFSTRRTLQHLLAPNSTGIGLSSINAANFSNTTVVAEAINVITFDALFQLIRLTVILRGDAIALTPQQRQQQIQTNMDANEEKNTTNRPSSLSNLTVKALFDPPRIIFGNRYGNGNLNFALGPATSVLLDTTYYDNNLRIGMGGTSGTRFVFSRCKEEDAEAREFLTLRMLQRRPIRKSKIVATLMVLGGSGVYASIVSVSGSRVRVLGKAVAFVMGLAALAVAASSGGVEDDDNNGGGDVGDGDGTNADTEIGHQS